MESGRRLFCQIITSSGCRTGTESADDLRAGALPASHLEVRFGGATTLLEAQRRVLRVLARALYLFPLLLVVKLILYVLARPGGDLLTLAFVGLVLLFFLALIVYLILFLVAGPPSTRVPHRRFAPPDGPLDEALAGLARELAPTPIAELSQLAEEEHAPRAPRPIRLQGIARAFNPEARSPHGLLLDAWDAGPDALRRCCRVEPFLVEAEGQPPVVVAPRHPPVLIAGYPEVERGSLEPEVRALLERLGAGETSTRLAVLREGDRVELVAEEAAPVRSLDELAVWKVAYAPSESAAASPYRSDRARRALLVEGTEDRPLILRRG